MNWWPFHDVCNKRVAILEDNIVRLNNYNDEYTRTINNKNREIDGYKCALDSHLSQINELKAVYNYQVADLEGKIKQLSDENDVLFKANKELLDSKSSKRKK